jgi:regulator of protease activity HflC (stomatin/prohibitin superfamily)
VKPDIVRLENQDLTTKDGVGVSVSANVLYEIFDARASFVAVQHTVASLCDECRSQLSHRIRDYNYEELLHDQSDLEEKCAISINAKAEEWGITIIRVSLADFIRTKHLSLTKT